MNKLIWFRELLKVSSFKEEQDPLPLIKWLETVRSKQIFNSHLIDLYDLDSWYVENKTGNIHSRSGEFFSIKGARVASNAAIREIQSWDQPIFTQKEGGVLALIAKEHSSQILFLLHAKAEPGNIDTFQLSPTVQASWSNLRQSHKGNRPSFTEVILQEVPSTLVYASSHNEEGSRFWKKSNQNQIWMCDPEALSLDYNSELFVWASLSQIKSLALMDNILNPYVKTIIAPL